MQISIILLQTTGVDTNNPPISTKPKAAPWRQKTIRLPFNLLPRVFFVSTGLISPLDTKQAVIKQPSTAFSITSTKTIAMARQNGLYFIGKMGNVVGSTWKGIPYLRYMPDKINQSEATKQSSANMALSSRIGAAFRKSFEPLLPQSKNRTTQNRFTGAIKKWLQTKPFEQTLPATVLPHLTGFDFNEASPVGARFGVAVKFETNEQQLLQLQMASFVPAQNIAAPAYTKAVTINIMVANCNVATCAITGYDFTQLSYAYNNDTVPAQLFTIPYSAIAGDISLALISLQYHTSRGTITDLRWQPCGIVAGYVK